MKSKTKTILVETVMGNLSDRGSTPLISTNTKKIHAFAWVFFVLVNLGVERAEKAC